MFLVIMRPIIISAMDRGYSRSSSCGCNLAGCTEFPSCGAHPQEHSDYKADGLPEHKASSWLECGGFPCNVSTSVRRQSGLS
jgi:hypothetical protein